MKIYCNGDLIPQEQIAEFFEPGFLFGWGVFEPLRVYGEHIAFLSEHIERLNRSLELLGIEKVEIDWEKAIRDTIVANKLQDPYVRITAYKKRKGTGVLIYANTFGYYGDEVYGTGFTSLISPYRRNSTEVASSVKALSYLQNRLSWLSAQKAKKHEALIFNEEGALVGGARSNLFLVKDKHLLMPAGSFDGITRKIVLLIAQKNKIQVSEEKMTRQSLTTCDEAFLTSALMEVMPLVECEGKPIGSGKPQEVTLKMLSEYRILARG